MSQLKYKSPIMQRDIKLPNWSSPRSRDKVPAVKKLNFLKKRIFSVLDVVVVVLAILAVKFLVNHVSVDFH